MSLRSLTLGALAATALFGATAANALTITYNQYYTSMYEPRALQYASGDTGQVQTVVRGNPFQLAQAEFQAAVYRAMYQNHFGADVNFADGPSGMPAYRVVLLFNDNFNGAFGALCSANPLPAGGGVGSGGVKVLAAFCVGDTVASEVVGTSGSVSGPDDPAFRALIGQVLKDLFPPRDPTRPDRNDFRMM